MRRAGDPSLISAWAYYIRHPTSDGFAAHLCLSAVWSALAVLLGFPLAAIWSITDRMWRGTTSARFRRICQTIRTRSIRWAPAALIVALLAASHVGIWLVGYTVGHARMGVLRASTSVVRDSLMLKELSSNDLVRARNRAESSLMENSVILEALLKAPVRSIWRWGFLKARLDREHFREILRKADAIKKSDGFGWEDAPGGGWRRVVNSDTNRTDVNAQHRRPR